MSGTIDANEYPQSQCAICGSVQGLCPINIKDEDFKGKNPIRGCQECLQSMNDLTLYKWFVKVRREFNMASDGPGALWRTIAAHQNLAKQTPSRSQQEIHRIYKKVDF